MKLFHTSELPHAHATFYLSIHFWQTLYFVVTLFCCKKENAWEGSKKPTFMNCRDILESDKKAVMISFRKLSQLYSGCIFQNEFYKNLFCKIQVNIKANKSFCILVDLGTRELKKLNALFII